MSSFGLWNCRGARERRASLYLKEIVKENGILFMGLLETKVTLFNRNDVDMLIGTSWDFFQVPSIGKSCGILITWKTDLASFNVFESSNQFVIGEIDLKNKGRWRMATIYGSLDAYERRILWEKLKLYTSNDIALVIGGDFNCILNKEDKKGGRRFVYSMGAKEMDSFLIYNDVHEVRSIGPKFTWSNNNSGTKKILEMLDRCYLNSAALSSHQHMVVKHLARIASDHCPIILKFQKFKANPYKVFKCEDVWVLNPSSFVIIKKSWRKKSEGDFGQVLNRKLRRVVKALFYWSKDKHKTLMEDKESLNKEILELQYKDCSVVLSEDECLLLKSKVGDLNSKLARLDKWWRQRDKVKWALEGDTNSNFFHAFASARKNENFINKIKDENGEETDDQALIEDIFFKFFKRKWEFRECNLEGWPKNSFLMEEEDLLLLNKEFSIDEVEMVVKNTGKFIAPRYDGVTYSFLKRY
ncbi:hypothetical protein KFK09_003924 [Dendrobium nobile]|uniref:Endonuclease/exonuclease/phosphatase domain-containing protein n=1 Tax=Dendrobium nobile TaxID=94219 RepID=A0A8T3C2L1_DENNO|nr:hypothetical protein KFK09_003924 [Dendrobium nobile]